MRINKRKVSIIMANKKMSISEVVKLSKMSSRTVFKLLNGNDCNIVSVGKLASALGVDVTEIIEEEE